MSATRHATHSLIVYSCSECRQEIPGWNEDQMMGLTLTMRQARPLIPPLTLDQRLALYALVLTCEEE